MDDQNPIERLCIVAKVLGERGWLPATSGNLSVLQAREPLQFHVTRSGADKQRLSNADVVTVDVHCAVLQSASQAYRPSAEACVHARLYERLHCGAVLHVHTLYNNLCSDVHFAERALVLANHELLKALGHWEPDASIRVPIVPNHHDLATLADAVGEVATADVPGVLVHNHGIYAFGDSLDAAFRHLEAFEFLFAYELMRRSLPF